MLNELRANAIADPNCNWCGAREVPASVSWKAMLSTDVDAGERIRIAGTVYGRDGKAAAPNTLIYMYHTDVHGVYGRNAEPRHGRYRGWMLTDERGKYEFETIMPASYPNSTISKHIHMTVTTTNQKEDWIDSILFDGDKFLTAGERVINRGGYDPVLKLMKNSSGMLTGVRDIRLG